MNIDTIVLLYFLGFFVALGEISKLGAYFFIALIIAISVGVVTDNATFRIVLGLIALFCAYRFARTLNFWQDGK